MGILMDTHIFQKEMGKVPKELIRAAMRAMGFDREGILPEMLLQDMLWGGINVVFPFPLHA